VGENCSTCPSDCSCASGQGCISGTCQSCQCKVGETRCVSERVERCAADCMTWQTIEVCQTGDNQFCDPQTGSCQCRTGNACTTPGQTRCKSDSTAEICVKGSKCSFWKSNVCPAKTFCNKGVCCSCYPGDRVCVSDEEYQKCGSNCQWGKPKECPLLFWCDYGDCVF
jgi:hypothetical protein